MVVASALHISVAQGICCTHRFGLLRFSGFSFPCVLFPTLFTYPFQQTILAFDVAWPRPGLFLAAILRCFGSLQL